MTQSDTQTPGNDTEAPTAVLAGPPDSVSGLIPFHNTGDTDVTVTGVVVEESDSTTRLEVPVEETVVPGGGKARLAVRLVLPPQTSPEPYPVTVTVVDQPVPTMIYVAEARLLGLSPDALVVDNITKATSVKHLVVSNQGNVTVHVADFGAVPLFREDAALGTMLPIARGSALDVPTDIDPLPEPDAEIEVHTAGGGRVAIEPGETRPVDLIVTIPDDLSQATRYLAALPVSVRTLLLLVVPAGEEPGGRRERPS